MFFALVLSLLPLVSTSPAAAPGAAARAYDAGEPLITPSPVVNDATKTYKHRRGVVSDVTGAIDSILSDLGNVPSYVASGVPNFFQDFPSGTGVQSKLSLKDDQVSALPTQVLNIP